MRECRLGDDIDDYCVRCKRIMNHSVVSVLNAEPAKVRCRTCHSDHDFKELVKRLHGVAEHHRVAVRNIRRDGNEAVKKLLKDKKITEDDEKKAHDEIQKLTDAYMEKIDLAAKSKEKEILEIR